MAIVTKLQRIANFALSLLMIVCGVLLLFEPRDGLVIVAAVLGIAFVIYGLRKLVYYLTMARHMAGGLSILFMAVIVLDISVFALAIIADPRISIVLYLVVYNLYTGVLAIARGVESKLFESRWALSVLHGLVNIALAVLCVAFVGSDQIVVAIFCIGLFYNAVVRLVSVFKPTEIIYIQ